MNTKTKWIYSASGIGKDMMYAMSTIMSIYMIDYVGIGSAFVGIMILVVRAWDAINDPIMGTVVDNTNTRWGKFRPWILIGTVLNAVILIFVFYNPGLAPSSIWMMIYVTVFYTLWGMSYTLMDIPFWSMIPSLSYKQEERSQISALTRIFTSIGFFLVSAPYLAIVKILGGGETDDQIIHGFFLLAIIVSIVFLLSQVIMVSNVKEKITPAHPKRITLKRMIELLKQNDQLLVVMVVVVISNFVLYTTSTMAFFYIKYDLGNEDLLFYFLLAGGVIQLVGSGVFITLEKKLKRKQIFNFSILLQIGAFILLLINAFILDNLVLLVFGFGLFVFFGQGLSMVLQTVLLSDTVEYGEYKTGRRSEAIVFSVQTFVVKLATGLASGVVGVGLAIFLYDSELTVQKESTLVGIRILMFVLPIIGLLLSRYIFNKYHTITEESYTEMVTVLKAQRGE